MLLRFPLCACNWLRKDSFDSITGFGKVNKIRMSAGIIPFKAAKVGQSTVTKENRIITVLALNAVDRKSFALTTMVTSRTRSSGVDWGYLEQKM